MVPACAGLMVAPIVAVLTASAAEMAMIVRFSEDADMVLVPFGCGCLAAPAQLYS
jgi:hypothetical protein